MSLRRAFAFHEAGHVAAALVLGYPVSRVWLHPRGGRTRHATIHDERDEALITFAGTLAQRRAVPASPLTVSDDFRRIDALCDRHGAASDRLQHAYVADAERLLDEHWDLVERVARELLEHGELRLCTAVADRIGAVLTR